MDFKHTTVKGKPSTDFWSFWIYLNQIISKKKICFA